MAVSANCGGCRRASYIGRRPLRQGDANEAIALIAVTVLAFALALCDERVGRLRDVLLQPVLGPRARAGVARSARAGGEHFMTQERRLRQARSRSSTTRSYGWHSTVRGYGTYLTTHWFSSPGEEGPLSCERRLLLRTRRCTVTTSEVMKMPRLGKLRRSIVVVVVALAGGVLVGSVIAAQRGGDAPPDVASLRGGDRRRADDEGRRHRGGVRAPRHAVCTCRSSTRAISACGRRSSATSRERRRRLQHGRTTL